MNLTVSAVGLGVLVAWHVLMMLDGQVSGGIGGGYTWRLVVVMLWYVHDVFSVVGLGAENGTWSVRMELSSVLFK